MPSSPKAVGALLVIAGSAGFGTVGVAVDGALAAGFALPTFLALRFALAGGAAALVASRQPAFRTRPGRPQLAALGLGVASIVQTACFFLALQRVDIALALALHFTFPAIVLALDAARRRRLPAPRESVGCALALGGVLLVVLGGGMGGADPVGLALAAGSGAAYALMVTVQSRILAVLHPAVASAWQFAGLALAWIVACLVLGEPLSVPGGAGALWLVGIALACTALPMLLLSSGISRVGPVMSSTLATVEPVVGAALAAVVLGQRPGLPALVGACLIVLAAVLVATPAGTTPAPVRRAAIGTRRVARAGARAALPVRRLDGGPVVAIGARREALARRLEHDGAGRGEQRSR